MRYFFNDGAGNGVPCGQKYHKSKNKSFIWVLMRELRSVGKGGKSWKDGKFGKHGTVGHNFTEDLVDIQLFVFLCRIRCGEKNSKSACGGEGSGWGGCCQCETQIEQGRW